MPYIYVEYIYRKPEEENMPRPCKKRLVCSNPGEKLFGPKGLSANDLIQLAVDEYEALRLIDVEGMTQEECARSMNVARSTVQAIYSTARKKLSTALIEDKNILVAGGDFVLCDGDAEKCPRKNCCIKKLKEQLDEAGEKDHYACENQCDETCECAHLGLCPSNENK